MEGKKPRPPRLLLVADAEIFDPLSSQLIPARTSDLSIGGCYVEMANPLPVRTAVRLQLTYNETSITLFGDVVRCEPGKGMAVRFRAIEPNQMATLKGWFFSFERPGW